MDFSICRSQQVQRSTFCHRFVHLFHTDSLPHTYKTSWSCQIMLQVLKFIFIPVDFNQCFARRTTGLGLSFSSSVKYNILNEIALTLSSKMPLGLHSWDCVPCQWDISISKGVGYCNSTTNTKSADAFLSKPLDTDMGCACNFKRSSLALAKFGRKTTCRCSLDTWKLSLQFVYFFM